MPEKFEPMKRNITTTVEVDISCLCLAKGHYVTVSTDDGHSVEVGRKDDGTLQVCVDDKTLESGVHRFEDIHGPNPFKEGT